MLAVTIFLCKSTSLLRIIFQKNTAKQIGEPYILSPQFFTPPKQVFIDYLEQGFLTLSDAPFFHENETCARP